MKTICMEVKGMLWEYMRLLGKIENGRKRPLELKNNLSVVRQNEDKYVRVFQSLRKKTFTGLD